MIIQRINNINNNTTFGMKFKLSDSTLRLLSESTKLSTKELRNLPMDKAVLTMRKRGSIQKPNKFKQNMAQIYKQVGIKIGLLK